MTDHSPAPPTGKAQFAGTNPTSPFGRALGELGVALIPAHSPQAKGQVAWLFKTVPDRLVSERRWAGIARIEAANRVLEEWRPIDHRRVTVQPAQSVDRHRHRPAHRERGRRRCLKTTRCRRHDGTIAHQRRRDQIHETIRAPHALVATHTEGTMRITHQGRPLGVHARTARPGKIAAGHTGPPTPAPGRAEAESSVAPTPAAGATNTGDGART